MSEAFDPYHAWLGIPPSKRPPTAHDLLGLEEGDTDLDRIQKAAAARYDQIRVFTLGPRREHAVRLQNEVSEALVVLLKDVPEELGEASHPPPLPDTVAHPELPPPPPLSEQLPEGVSPRPERRHRSSKTWILAPVLLVDKVLRSVAGEGNTILHAFLRGAAAIAVLLVFLGVLLRTVSQLGGQAAEERRPGAFATSVARDARTPALLEPREDPDESLNLPDQADEPDLGRAVGVEAEPDEPGATQPEMGSEEPSADKPEPRELEPDSPEEQPETETPAAEAPSPEELQPRGPLRNFADVVDLPERSGRPDSGTRPPEVFTVGRIHSAPDVAWQLFLLGGHAALDRDRAFVLQPGELRDDQQAWLVQLETSKLAGPSARKDVARIWRDKNDALRFQWAEEAPADANSLRNCVLLIRVGAESTYVALAEPKAVDPIPIDLDRDTLSRRIPVKGLPRSGSLRVEITQVEGSEGYAVDLPEPAEVKTPLELRFPRADRHGDSVDQVAFRLTFAPRSSEVRVDLQLLSPPAATFERFNRDARAQRGGLDTDRETMNRLLSLINIDRTRRASARFLPSAAVDESKEAQQARLLLNEELDRLETRIWCTQFYEQVHRRAKIHFRLFVEIDGRRVVLASTQPPSVNPAPTAGRAHFPSDNPTK